jgi:hypothetical protein
MIYYELKENSIFQKDEEDGISYASCQTIWIKYLELSNISGQN